MKCPHCGIAFHDVMHPISVGADAEGNWTFLGRDCPECKRKIFALQVDGANPLKASRRSFLCHPRAISRAPVSSEVPESFASDYKEACLTLTDSPKASAALSRRCLQHVLHAEFKINRGNLAEEIQQVIDAGKLPTLLLNSLDAIRNVGNFAAHPTKAKSSGEILDVEAGEAEWNLEVLESLFDYVFVQPATLKKKAAELNVKLAAAGKPPLKVV